MKRLLKLLTLIVFASFCCQTSFAAYPTSYATSSTIQSVRASHILVDTKEEALAIKAKIDKGESFEAMAKKYSKCPSGQNGGDLGYFGKGEMVPSFEAAAFSLPLGKVSEPVQTQFGWHLIKVTDKE